LSHTIEEVSPRKSRQNLLEKVLDGQRGRVAQTGNTEEQYAKVVGEGAHGRDLVVRGVSNDAADDESLFP
jgi:hypothetical protein